MTRTEFAEAVARDITAFEDTTGKTGADLHASVMGQDTGERFIVTGKVPNGRRFRREYRSAAAAYASYRACRAAWASKSIWHVEADGSLTLVHR